jgi:hypothetical protein
LRPLGLEADNGSRTVILTAPEATGGRVRESKGRTGQLRVQWDVEVIGRER